MSLNGILLLATLGALIALVLILFLPGQRARAGSGSPTSRNGGVIYRDDDRYWYLTFFYYNPEDPDPFVPKRYGLGWTINFGHPVGKVIAAFMVAMILLPLALALFGVSLGPGCHPSGCHLLP